MLPSIVFYEMSLIFWFCFYMTLVSTLTRVILPPCSQCCCLDLIIQGLVSVTKVVPFYSPSNHSTNYITDSVPAEPPRTDTRTHNGTLAMIMETNDSATLS